MSKSMTCVIIGGGLAAAKSAEALRDNDFDGRIVLFGAEKHLPYERPPLSKDYLAGKKTLNDFTPFDSVWYDHHDIDLRLGVHVTSLDLGAHRIEIGDGIAVDFDKLVLATGSRARHPAIPGSDAVGVHFLRTLDDASALDEALIPGSSLAVVGGGWIGLEVAATARQRGVRVTVIERSEVPLMNALGPRVGAVFADLHRAHEVDLRLRTEVSEVTTAAGQATGIQLGDGSVVAAETVLIAVGAQPNIELADTAGLRTGDGGVLANASLRTSDPYIFAVGDIVNAWHPLFGCRIRTEHWANALKQPAVAAAAMLGRPAEYLELPYFFTDQYDLSMEYVGHAPRDSRVVFRGDVEGRQFVAFWIDGGGRVLAGMNVNVWDVLDDVKELIRNRRAVDVDHLTDARHPLGELISV